MGSFLKLNLFLRTEWVLLDTLDILPPASGIFPLLTNEENYTVHNLVFYSCLL